MKEVILSNGIKMPLLGFGMYQITKPEECERCVIDAIDAGYRLIDTAECYMNESAIGQALKSSQISRQEIFITSKVWVQNSGYNKTLEAIERSLNHLQTEYLDMYLIHQPFGDVHGSWRAMEHAYKLGKIKVIGVCNFYPDRLMDLMIFNEIPPALNQIEINPFFQQSQNITFMRENAIHPQAWSPLANGKQNPLTNQVLMEIGHKYGKSPASIILRWLLDQGIASLAKSSHKERMLENINIAGFELDDSDLSRIAKLDTGHSSFFSHQDPAIIKLIGETSFDI